MVARQSNGEERDDDDGDRERETGHVPVLLDEVVEALQPRAGAVVFDGTVGLGGHAEAVLRRVGPEGKLIGADRDEEALERARVRLARVGNPFVLHRGLFTRIREFLLESSVAPEGGLDGILLDLGVSSLQLDSPKRGFSFLADGPLDMRMSPGEGMSAADWLETASAEDIEKVLREFGEEPSARKIARAIDRRRHERPIRTTHDLVEVVERVKPRRGRRLHPATRVFQAIRIQVNGELAHLTSFLDSADRYLGPGGRLVVLSYHSLEDRLVKRTIRQRVREGIFEKHKPELIRPGEKEVRENPRSRSARLRVGVRRGETLEGK